MEPRYLDLSVGARIWHDGSAWTVVEHDGARVALRSGDHLKRVHGTSLVDVAEPLDDSETPRDDSELHAVILGSLNSKQRKELERQAQVFDELLLDATHTPTNDLYQAVADELGVSLRTAYRRGRRYAAEGLVGLVDSRLTRPQRPSVDSRWDAACIEVLESYRDRSNPTMKTVLEKTNALFGDQNPQGVAPSRSVAYRRIQELDAGRYTFGAAKQRRSVAQRPQGMLGRLRADRPGQYVVLDTTRLDVFAMEPLTGRWLNTELTVAMDLHSRCILGLVLRVESTTAQDVASVLYQVVTPQRWGPMTDEAPAPYAGVPENLLTQSTGALPDTIVVDHGKVYLAARTKAVCQRLGINIQPAIPHKPTDKPTVERFFRTLRQQLLEGLPAYKGPDVASRGKNVEDGAFYYVSELETIIREWVGIYHHTAHRGLCDPHFPEVQLSPAEMFARGVATAGVFRLPASQDLRMEFLDVAWRTIQHYGVEINGRRYDGPSLNLYRGTKSKYGGAHPGHWPFMMDLDDVRKIFFQDPVTRTWHGLEWEHAPGLDAPFSAEAAKYTRQLSVKANRHVDPGSAIAELLQRHSTGSITEKRERSLARRLAASSTSHPSKKANKSKPNASPEVIDLFAHLDRRREQQPAEDDLDDVFSKYVAENPEGTTEVLD